MTEEAATQHWCRDKAVLTPEKLEIHRYGVLQFDTKPIRGVYFVRCDNFVKIGHAKDIRKRIADIAQMNPHRVWLLAYVPTECETESRYLEGTLHDRFRDDRYRLEWFHYTERIRAFVEAR